jgi:hypothetical protein
MICSAIMTRSRHNLLVVGILAGLAGALAQTNKSQTPSLSKEWPTYGHDLKVTSPRRVAVAADMAKRAVQARDAAAAAVPDSLPVRTPL